MFETTGRKVVEEILEFKCVCDFCEVIAGSLATRVPGNPLYIDSLPPLAGQYQIFLSVRAVPPTLNVLQGD